MNILISAIILIGKILIAVIGLIAVLVAVWFGWAAYVRAGARAGRGLDRSSPR